MLFEARKNFLEENRRWNKPIPFSSLDSSISTLRIPAPTHIPELDSEELPPSSSTKVFTRSCFDPSYSFGKIREVVLHSSMTYSILNPFPLYFFTTVKRVQEHNGKPSAILRVLGTIAAKALSPIFKHNGSLAKDMKKDHSKSS